MSPVSGELRDYEIVKTIRLKHIDYENFATDMQADRGYLENNAALCKDAPVLQCLLICEQRNGGGILVFPCGAYVEMAALFS